MQAEFCLYIQALSALLPYISAFFSYAGISDEKYSRMASMYKNEQKWLIKTISGSKRELERAEQQNIEMQLLPKTFRELTDFRELTPTIITSPIQRIETHNNDKYNGHFPVQTE